MTWTQCLNVDGCHRWFRDEQGRIAPADNSGKYPDETDDGVLYLDQTLPIIVEEKRYDREFPPNIIVRLMTPEGKQVLLHTTMDEVRAIEQRFGMQVITRIT